MGDIYSYLDYRAYLKDHFAERKARNPSFSHQVFARKADIKSSGFMLHVMKGQRNLTKAVLHKVARALGLNEPQTEYFEDLVSFDQAKTQSEREHYLSRIAARRQRAKAKTLEDSQFEFYSAWYHSVVRELVTLLDNPQNPAAMAKLTVPSITPTQAKKSLALQEELGILQKDGEGKYRQTEPFVTGGGPVRNTAIVAFQKQMLQRAMEAWDRFAANEICMNTVTLCMSEALLETIKQEIRGFKQRLLQIVSEEKREPERVYHINLDLIPVTKTVKRSAQ